jgi:hypothetical protein
VTVASTGADGQQSTNYSVSSPLATGETTPATAGVESGIWTQLP